MAVIMLVLLVTGLITAAVVDRAVANARQARADQDWIAASSAADVAVADALARIEAGQPAGFNGSGAAAPGVAWSVQATPIGTSWAVTATGTAGRAVRQVAVTFEPSGAGGFRQASWRELRPSPYAAVVFSLPGLQTYWRMDDTGGSTLVDASGHGRDAGFDAGVALNQPGALTDDPAPGVVFTGAGPGASAGDLADFAGTSPFSVAAWVRLTGPVTDWWRLVSAEHANGGRSGWTLLGLNGGTAVGLERWQAGSGDGAHAVLQLGRWHHVVGTYDGATVRLYLDGTLVSSNASTRAIAADPTPLRIGARADTGNNRFVGGLDEIAIWDRALTAAEVRRLHLAGTGQGNTP